MAKKSTTSANSQRMKMIQAEAKKFWATGKLSKYSDAVKKASDKLKKEGRL